MSLQVVFLASAEQDLKELRSYIVGQFGAATWQTSYSKIKAAVNGLQNFPLSGTLPVELASLNLTQYRQVVVDANRIIYEIRDDRLYIHVVCDSRKELKALLTRRLLRTP